MDAISQRLETVINMDKNEKNRLLRIRAAKKKKQPPFVRVESWRYDRVKESWRHPRGIDSHTREKRKSGIKSPSVGYRTPKAVRGLHPSGLEDILVFHLEELEALDPEIHGIRIAARLGGRKRLSLIEAAEEKGFRVLNYSLESAISEEMEAELEVDDELMEEQIDELDQKILTLKQKHIQEVLERQEKERQNRELDAEALEAEEALEEEEQEEEEP